MIDAIKEYIDLKSMIILSIIFLIVLLKKKSKKIIALYSAIILIVFGIYNYFTIPAVGIVDFGKIAFVKASIIGVLIGALISILSKNNIMTILITTIAVIVTYFCSTLVFETVMMCIFVILFVHTILLPFYIFNLKKKEIICEENAK